MNKPIAAMALFAIIICLSGCAGMARRAEMEKALNACPNPGINTAAPDFTSINKPKAVNAFYECQISILAPENITKPHSKLGMIMAANNNIPNLDDLRYQHTLWKQIFTKQKTAEAAQEAWLLWQHQS
jgi:hypothetical protein